MDQLEIFFRKLTGHLPENPTDLSVLLMLLTSVMKLPIITTPKVSVDVLREFLITNLSMCKSVSITANRV